MTAAAVETADDGWVTASVQVDPDDPVFAGHYPGFPVLPGIYVIEHVHRTVSAADGRLRLAGMERAKFIRPVRPGDQLRIEARLSAGDEDRVLCVATVFTRSGPVVELRLVYAVTETGGKP